MTFGLDVGGLERLLVEFARNADRTRFQLTFLSLGARGGAIADEIQACGWPVIGLDQPSGLRPMLVFRLARLFASRSVDVIHTHEPRAIFYGGPAAKLLGVRLLHTQHGRLTWATPRQVGVFRQLSRLAQQVVAVSHDCADELARMGLSTARLMTIHNGVDLTRFRYVGPTPRGPVVTIARLSPEKDVANLVYATEIAVQQNPTIRVLVAGDGPCRGELERLIAQLGLQKHICLLGEIKDVASLLATASMFVLPSRTEGISLTLLEAMACGLPVVATQVGGTPEVLIDPRLGTMVPACDPRQLALAMVAIWQDETHSLRMGREARLRVEQGFDLCRMIRAYEDIYSSLDQHSERE